MASFHPAAPLDTLRVQETLHDAVLRIDKALKRKGWQGRLDDPFAEAEPALAHHWITQARQTSGRLARSVAMKLAWKVDVLQCDCGGRCRLVALIAQPPVIKKVLAHLGLATEALTKPEDPVWLPKSRRRVDRRTSCSRRISMTLGCLKRSVLSTRT